MHVSQNKHHYSGNEILKEKKPMESSIKWDDVFSSCVRLLSLAQVTDHRLPLHTLTTPFNNSSSQGACLVASKTYAALKKTGDQIYLFSCALFHCFNSGSTYENLQRYLILYSNFCASLHFNILRFLVLLLLRTKCLFMGNHAQEEIFKGTVCCFHPLNTFNGTESGKKIS